jgi:hypothetical protein
MRNAISITQLKFNKAGLVKTLDQATTKFLNRAGSFVRTSARSSIRSSRKSSKPGSPPSSPTKRLRGSIFFALEESGGKASCVIGPTLLDSTNRFVKTSLPISQILEQGGQVIVQQEQYTDGTWHRAGLRKPSSIQVTLPKRWVKISVAARPFMRPALLTNIPKFAGIWRGLFNKG